MAGNYTWRLVAANLTILGNVGNLEVGQICIDNQRGVSFPGAIQNEIFLNSGPVPDTSAQGSYKPLWGTRSEVIDRGSHVRIANYSPLPQFEESPIVEAKACLQSVFQRGSVPTVIGS
jgi:hypothetical protein